jgi:23S rRNA (pseudouridine1915-N3)-methyltransferase
MRIAVAAIGRLKAGAERELAERYRDRAAKAGRSLGVQCVEIIEIRESRARDAERRLIEEAVALASVVPEGALIAVLDCNGANLASDSFAGQIRAWRDAGKQTVCFLIGGADGIGPALREQADVTLAFGAATWPHQLVRIMLMEQIYRAVTILSGHPYHRD